MITNQEQLDQAVARLGQMYHALASLRADMSSRSPKAFALLAEGPLNQIRQLETEIAEYAGADEARALEADVWIRVEGSSTTHETSITRLTAVLNAFRLGILDIADFLRKAQIVAGLTFNRLREECDFRVIASETGSVRVGLEVLKSEGLTDRNGLSPEKVLVSQALERYLEIAASAASRVHSQPTKRLDDHSPDFERVVLNAVKRLIPPRHGTVELYGKMVGKVPIRLTNEAGFWIKEHERELRQTSNHLQTRAPRTPDEALVIEESDRQSLLQGMPIAVVGELRRVDFDTSSIFVRQSEGNRYYECRFEAGLLDKVRQGIGHKVRLHLQAPKPDRPIEPFLVADLELIQSDSP